MLVAKSTSYVLKHKLYYAEQIKAQKSDEKRSRKQTAEKADN
jgi:hypothetical protein